MDQLQDQAHGMDDYDEDTKITNTGQRIRAIVVAVVAIAAAIGAVVWWNMQKAEAQRHADARAAFQKAHVGYTDFWKKADIDIKGFKSNRDFELRMKQILTDDPVRYARFTKEESLPILDKALPAYKSITVPQDYAEQMDGMVKAVENLRGAWNDFADELLKFDLFFKGKKELNKAADAWLGAQQSNDPKYQTKAFKYFKLLGCVLPDKEISEIETTELNSVVQNSCVKDKSAWFRRIAYECLPTLLEKAGKPNEGFAKTIKASRGAERMDHSSKFGIEDCLKSTRGSMEEEMIESIALAWAGYVKAQNELLNAIDAKIKEFK